MLSVEGLHSLYGRAHILADVTLEARRGEVVVLLGRNGAGKSTTMKAIMGLVPPERRPRSVPRAMTSPGRQPLRDRPAGPRLRAGGTPHLHRLTVMENLEVGRQPPTASGAPHWTPERLFTLFPNLGGMRDRPGGRMSGGEQQMLTIARTLMGNPSAILLDEPSRGSGAPDHGAMAHAIIG